jgi:hypothetical protein
VSIRTRRLGRLCLSYQSQTGYNETTIDVPEPTVAFSIWYRLQLLCQRMSAWAKVEAPKFETERELRTAPTAKLPYMQRASCVAQSELRTDQICSNFVVEESSSVRDSRATADNATRLKERLHCNNRSRTPEEGMRRGHLRHCESAKICAKESSYSTLLL